MIEKPSIYQNRVFLSPRWAQQKLPAMLLYLGEPSVRFLWCCCSSFLIFILLLYLHLSMFFILLLFFIHILFSASSLTLPWTIAGFLHPFYTFSPAHRRVIRDTFIFRPFHLAASATALSGHFLPTSVFYLTLLHRNFNLRLSTSYSELFSFKFCHILAWVAYGESCSLLVMELFSLVHCHIVEL